MFSGKPWYVKLLLILLVPVVYLTVVPLVCVILLFAASVVCIVVILLEIRFYLQMRWRGRFLSWRQWVDRLERGGTGTLIVDSPTLGWGMTRAWWTPEMILRICPYPQPTDEEVREAHRQGKCLDWNRWHWDNYVHPCKGRAYLLFAWNGVARAKRVRQAYPSIDEVRPWTGSLGLVDLPSDANAS
jgi:hypothetical protein